MTIISPLPFTLVNGTLEDATQVMADFNQIYNDSNNNAAHNGANTDITSLSNLTTPLSITQGGSGSAGGLSLADGGCYFPFNNNTQCILTPFGGGNLIINGLLQPVPAITTLNNTGGVIGGSNLIQNVFYYVYAYMSAGVFTLGASVTVPTLDSFGRYNLSSDTTKRLVGYVYPTTGTPGIFADGATYNGVASFFNPKAKVLSRVSSPNTASTTVVLISAALTFIGTHLDSSWPIAVVGSVSNASAALETTVLQGDGGNLQIQTASVTAGGNVPFAIPFLFTPASNPTNHTINVNGATSAGSATWTGLSSQILVRN